MKITRNHLRQIIKEEISRIVEQADADSAWEPGPEASEEDVFLNKLMNASNELAPGFSDPLDDLAEKLMAGEVSLEFAQSEAFEMMDLLAQLDNAAEIGVIQAAELLGL